ncbi:MAG: DNA primase [Clostridia bacterium]|nr:DNA primase [Clostridia bacterium]NLS85123.1 DNA primase [Oscillospiraceae bacterium]
MIPQEYIYELTQRNDIVDVIKGYVQLKQRGRIHSGLCPFHNERTPSFTVYPETQSFYCFGCGAGGDVITFAKRINNIDYIEAVKMLAARVGMSLPDEDDKIGKLRSKILSINKSLARFYYDCLNSDEGRDARLYWRKRGLSDATIRRFGLGYSPDSFGRARDYLYSKGYTEDDLLQAGVIGKSEKGSTYDFFRNRAMIPIFDLRGNVIAFSGRDFTSEKPQRKYVNSRETLVYKKSRNLFAMNIAKKSGSRRYILCEGNLDAISMHQAGFDTAVAGCGTALTVEQVKLLSDYADEVVLCYDSDEAGQKATAKAISLFENSPIKVTVLSIPNAKDPDEFIKNFGADKFSELLNGSSNAVEYELKKTLAKYDIKTPDGRVGYMRDAVNILAGRLTPIERDVYAGRLAEETDVSKQAVLTQLDAAVKSRQRRAAKAKEQRLVEESMGGTRINARMPSEGQKAFGVAFAERQLVGAILQTPQYIKLAAQKLKPDDFISADMSSVYALMLAHDNEGRYIDLALLAGELPDETVNGLSSIIAHNNDIKLSERDVNTYIDRILKSKPESAEAAAKTPQELAQYINNLKKEKK